MKKILLLLCLSFVSLSNLSSEFVLFASNGFDNNPAPVDPGSESDGGLTEESSDSDESPSDSEGPNRAQQIENFYHNITCFPGVDFNRHSVRRAATVCEYDSQQELIDAAQMILNRDRSLDGEAPGGSDSEDDSDDNSGSDEAPEGLDSNEGSISEEGSGSDSESDETEVDIFTFSDREIDIFIDNLPILSDYLTHFIISPPSCRTQILDVAASDRYQNIRLFDIAVRLELAVA